MGTRRTPIKKSIKSEENGGDGGIRTLDTRSRYGSLAGNWFQPLTHVSATLRVFWLRAARYNHAKVTRQGVIASHLPHRPAELGQGLPLKPASVP